MIVGSKVIDRKNYKRVKLKQALSGILLVLYIFSICHPGELLKIPFAVRHFQHHKAMNSQLNMWKFFCDHYLQLDDCDGDIGEDMKLPFKDKSNCINLKATYLEEGLILFSKIHNEMIERTVISKNKPHSYEYKLVLLQPPNFIFS
ncbi:MAG: hypothetical protein ABI844_13890 [Saprospiraceae bacterium]